MWTPTPKAIERVKGSRVLVMGSGNGSNFAALHRTLSPYKIEFAGLFCDKPGAYIIERAKQLGVPLSVLAPLPPDSTLHPKRHLNDQVLAFLNQPFDALALAGYMRILPPRVIAPYADRILNIHPSLLPAHPGLHALQQAYDAGDTTIGVTVHLVTPEVDAGPILGQSSLEVAPGEAFAAVEERIHALEHALYPQVLFDFLVQHKSHSVHRESSGQ